MGSHQTSLSLLLFFLSAANVLSAHSPGTVVSAGGWGPPPNLSNVVAVAAGEFFHCALTREGNVVGWGNHPSIDTQPGNSNVIAVAAFGEESSDGPGQYVLMLRRDGTVSGFSRSGVGIDYLSGFTNVVAVTPGFILRGDGAVISSYGDLFPNWYSGPQWNSVAAVPAGLTNVVSVAGEGSYGATVVRVDGSVFSWNSPAPAGLTNVAAVSRNDINRRYQLFLKTDGTFLANTNNYFPPPSTTNDTAQVSVGYSHSLALKTDGRVIQWGHAPFFATDVTNAVAIAAGAGSSLAVIDSGLPPWVQLTSGITTRLGQNALIVANVSGRFPLTYQWRCNGTNVPNATNSYFFIEHTQESDVGMYSVEVRNSLGTNVSNGTTLFIDKSPVIPGPPDYRGAFIGGNLHLSVSFNSPLPVTFQWQCNGTNIVGATNATFVITNAQAMNSGSYSVVVGNQVLTNTSPAAQVWVNPPAPAIGWIAPAVQDTIDWSSANAVATDTEENVYVTGLFFGSVTFGSHQLTAPGTYDIFLVKFDRKGTPLWAWQAGSADRGAGMDLASAGDGSIYLSGYFDGTITVGTNVLTATSGNDSLLVRFDPDGNVDWARTGQTDWSTDIAVDTADNCYFTGSLAGTATYGTNILTGTNYRIVLGKYNRGGELSWIQQFGGGMQADWAGYVSVDDAGNCYISTHISNTNIAFGSVTLSNIQNSKVVVKIDPHGNTVWARRVGISNVGDVYVTEPLTDTLGNLYLVGSVGGRTDWRLDFGSGIVLTNISSTNAYPYEGFVAKFDTNGNALWARQSDHGNSGFGAAGLDRAGNIYMAGTPRSHWSPLASRFRLGSTTFEDSHGYLAKCDTNGDYVWARSISVSNWVDIAVARSGASYVTGYGTNLFTRVESDRPFLNTVKASGSISLSWPDTEFGHILETKTDLSEDGWETVTAPAVMTNSQHSVTIPIVEPKQFYRLRAR